MDLSGTADIAVVVLWVGAAAAVVLLIAAILRSRFGGSRQPTKPARVLTTSAPPPAAEPDVPLAEHERLAAAGDYAGAVHALLGRALVVWRERGGELPQHATARDALRRARSVTVVGSLAHLVGVVEHVRYGGQPADRAMYEASRSRLHDWEATCRQSR